MCRKGLFEIFLWKAHVVGIMSRENKDEGESAGYEE